MFFLCISRVQTMHLEHQSLRSIIIIIIIIIIITIIIIIITIIIIYLFISDSFGTDKTKVRKQLQWPAIWENKNNNWTK